MLVLRGGPWCWWRMKRGFPTDPSLLAYPPPANDGYTLVELRPLIRRPRDSDSGLGQSLLGSSYDTSMHSNWSADVALTPTSIRSDCSLHTPHPPSSSKRRHYCTLPGDASPIGNLRPCAEEASGSGSPILGLSSSRGVSEFRFDGAQISSLGGSGLIKIGSPQTECLETPKFQKERRYLSENSRGINRKLPMPAPHPTTPSKCLPFSPTKGLDLFDSLHTSTPLRTDFDPLHPILHSFQETGPLRGTKRKTGQPPLTPTPIKRAMEIAMANKTPPHHIVPLAEARSQFADLQEIIRKDSGPCQGIDYTTPSKMMRWEREVFDAPYLGGLEAHRSPLQTLPPSNNLFIPPDHTPEKMTAAWCRIALGKTSPQRELTEQAKSFLSQPTYTFL